MATALWLNGEFSDLDSARVSALDAGLQHAVGLFETMHAREGRVFRLFEHLTRLQRSARELGLCDSLRINPLAEAVRRAVERADERRTRVRLTITGGDLSAIAGPSSAGSPKGGHEPTILIVAQRAVEYPEALFERGVTALLAETRVSHADPMGGHKTLNYWWRLRELQRAGANGAAESLLFDTAHRLASGMVSNVFVVKGGVMFTPPARGEGPEDFAAGDPRDEAARAGGEGAASAVLPGITRSAVLGFAQASGMEARVEPLGIHEALGADEVFLTNSGWGVLPVTRVEAAQIGSGVPGAVSRAMRAKWLGAILEEENG